MESSVGNLHKTPDAMLIASWHELQNLRLQEVAASVFCMRYCSSLSINLRAYHFLSLRFPGCKTQPGLQRFDKCLGLISSCTLECVTMKQCGRKGTVLQRSGKAKERLQRETKVKRQGKGLIPKGQSTKQECVTAKRKERLKQECRAVWQLSTTTLDKPKISWQTENQDDQI